MAANGSAFLRLYWKAAGRFKVYSGRDGYLLSKRYTKISFTGRKDIWEDVSPVCPQVIDSNGKTE